MSGDGITSWLPGLQGQLDPVQRWSAARDPFSSTGSATVWVVVCLVVLCGAGLIVLGAFLYSHLRRQRQRRQFEGGAEKLGLSPQERKLLMVTARLSGLKRPNAVFTMADAFDRGTQRLLGSNQLAALGDQRRQETAALLQGLREKLGFQSASIGNNITAIGVGRLEDGRALSVFRQQAQDHFDAVVTGSNQDGTELEVAPAGAIQCKPGETWQIRMSDEGLLWEMAGSVVKQMEDRVVIRPDNTVRCVNRRRFARTPTSKRAFMAPFPFLKDDYTIRPPSFLPATLIELAGPGLRLEGSAEVEPGDKILVGVEFTEGRVLEGLAVVRRVSSGRDGAAAVAAEVIGLTTSEVGELTRETNLAIKAVEDAGLTIETASAGEP